MIYYWETETGSGSFYAASDEEALSRKPVGCWVLYKENNTPDGTPFIILFEHGSTD